MEELNIVQKIVVMALPLVFAIVLHEVAHGWVADKLGDNTARSMGRLTLNPISHIDLFGTIIMPLMLFVLTNGKMVFGYAKPVPINPYNFKDPKKGMALSSLAGPGINLVMAISFSLLLRVVFPPIEAWSRRQSWDMVRAAHHPDAGLWGRHQCRSRRAEHDPHSAARREQGRLLASPKQTCGCLLPARALWDDHSYDTHHAAVRSARS